MARRPVPPSKNLAEQEAKRAAKSTSSAIINTAVDSKKETKASAKSAEKPKEKNVIVNSKPVKDNSKKATTPKEVETKSISGTSEEVLKKINKAAVKKEKEKPTEPIPLTDEQITDSILEDMKEKEDAKKSAAEVPEVPKPEPIVEATESNTIEGIAEEVSVALANDGEGVDKPFVPFPQTDMTNTTTLMVKAYDLDCPKLPSAILNELNKLNTLLTEFLREGRIEKLPDLQAQDGITSQLLGAYVTEKGLVKAPIAGGIPAPASAGIQVNSAAPLPPVQYSTPEFLVNNPANGSPAQLMQVDQQGLAVRIVTDINYAKKCADDLAGLAKSTFQFGMWGYIPLSVLNEMIATTNNQFKYEVVLDTVDFKNSYVKVISPEGIVETERFGIQ